MKKKNINNDAKNGGNDEDEIKIKTKPEFSIILLDVESEKNRKILNQKQRRRAERNSNVCLTLRFKHEALVTIVPCRWDHPLKWMCN